MTLRGFLPFHLRSRKPEIPFSRICPSQGEMALKCSEVPKRADEWTENEFIHQTAFFYKKVFFFKSAKNPRKITAYEICLISQPHITYVVTRPKKKKKVSLNIARLTTLQLLFFPMERY
jgi:hypothetical protein